MAQKAIGFGMMAALIALTAGACANGIIAQDDAGVPRHDGGTGNDGSTTKDTGTTIKDSSTPIQDGTTCSYTVCGSLCVDTTQDDSNCGSCGKACTGGSSCTNSTCQCSGGMTLCTSGCVDTTTDNSNCGTCNHVCSSGTTCMNSTCQAQTSGTPPQGSCSHDLCTAFLGPLNQGCSSCATSVCLADSYCCSTDWDDLCVSEVATYCSPYSCP